MTFYLLRGKTRSRAIALQGRKAGRSIGRDRIIHVAASFCQMAASRGSASRVR